MGLMLQQDEPDDYVIASGKSHSVRDVLEAAFNYVGLDYRDYFIIDDKLYRPTEVNILQGDPAKASEKLGWSATISFEELVKEMVEGDIEWYSGN